MRLPNRITLALLLLPSSLLAQHTDHAGHAASPAIPLEPGQGAFAAISEIVEMLSNDPTTDWSRVDLAALRTHLVDMDRLVTETEVIQTDIPKGLELRVPLPDRNNAALRMVPAHAPVLAKETGWTSTVKDGGDTLIWTIIAPLEDLPRLRALGFFGLMATGNHHRAHHLALARGMAVH